MTFGVGRKDLLSPKEGMSKFLEKYRLIGKALQLQAGDTLVSAAQKVDNKKSTTMMSKTVPLWMLPKLQP